MSNSPSKKGLYPMTFKKFKEFIDFVFIRVGAESYYVVGEESIGFLIAEALGLEIGSLFTKPPSLIYGSGTEVNYLL